MTIPRTYAAIITAAGRGTRAGGDLPKQWRKLGRDSALARSIRAFAGFSRIIVTVAPQDMDRALAEIAGPVVLVAGGETRSASIRAALETLEGSDITHVLIHDGARPLVSDAVIRGVVDALRAGAQAFGRHPDEIVVLPGLSTVLGSTEAEARATSSCATTCSR